MASKWTLTALRQVFSDTGIRPKKSLGQNFLIDYNLLRFIVAKAGILPTDTVIEIGAGVGSLTVLLTERARKVYAFEIDKNLYNICKNYLRETSNIQLYNEDVIRAINEGGFVVNTPNIKVVANLPYSKYFEILLSLLTSRLSIRELYLLVQFDVYKKMSATVGSKEYSPLSIIVQSLCDIRLIRKVPRDVFYPRPKIISAFVALKLLDKPLIDRDKIKVILSPMRTLFSERKKTIVNVLKKLFKGGSLDRFSHCIGGDILQKRVQVLEPQDVIRVASFIATVKHISP